MNEISAVLYYFVFVSGKTSKEKLKDVRAEMSEKGVRLLVVSALDEVACKEPFLFLNTQ
jgi:hypothetical protein